MAALVVAACAVNPQFAFGCDQIPAGQTFRIRLLQPVASYSSTAGTSVRGYVIESPVCDGLLVLPTGSIVEGHIVSVQKVGLGFRHETSALKLEFDRVIEDGAPVEIRAGVLSVENARAQVKNGVIRGARSTKTMHGVFGNSLGYVMMWHPASFWIVPATRAAFSIFPEPELYFPPGTDLLLKLSAPVPVAADEGVAPLRREFTAAETSAFDQEVLALPERSYTPKGVKADVINLEFIGTQNQLELAFRAAGWLGSDASSRSHEVHQYSAFVFSRSYPRSPMSNQFLEGNAAEFNWQKGLDSIAKRDHLRVWGDQLAEQDHTVWLAASTRDVGIRMMVRDRKFTHRVESDIDVERERVVRDLTLAGCVESIYRAPRAVMPVVMVNATGDTLRTDGAVAIVRLKDCEAPAFAEASTAPSLVTRPPTKFARYVRTQVLSFRDLWRENAAYNAFDLSRMAVRSWRRKHDLGRAVTIPLLQRNEDRIAALPY